MYIPDKAVRASRHLPLEKRGTFLVACLDYVDLGVEPQDVDPDWAMSWEMIVEDLDHYRAKAAAGALGGKRKSSQQADDGHGRDNEPACAKQKRSTCEANAKRDASKAQADAKQKRSTCEADAKQDASKRQAKAKPVTVTVTVPEEPPTKGVGGSFAHPRDGDEAATIEGPSLDDVLTYARANCLWGGDRVAQAFFDQFQANGWVRGNGVALDTREKWQARLRMWASEQQEREAVRSGRGRVRGGADVTGGARGAGPVLCDGEIRL